MACRASASTQRRGRVARIPAISPRAMRKANWSSPAARAISSLPPPASTCIRRMWKPPSRTSRECAMHVPSRSMVAAVRSLQPRSLMSDASMAEAAVTSANATLADYQQIRRWLLWPDPDFPRTSTGKVKRREVAARAQLAFASKGEVSASDDTLIQALRAMPGARVENVSDATRLSEDIGLDSLGLVELQSALEQQFAVEIPDDAWQQVRTIGDLRKLDRASDDIGRSRRQRFCEHFACRGSRHPRRRLQTRQSIRAGPGAHPSAGCALLSWNASRFRSPACCSVRVSCDRTPSRRASRSSSWPITSRLTMFHWCSRRCPRRIRRHTAVAMAGGLLTGWRHARAERHPWFRPLTPLAYWLVTALFNVFPLPQGAGFRRSFAHAGAAMDHGMSVILFPEGHRSADATLGAIPVRHRSAGARIRRIGAAGGHGWSRRNQAAQATLVPARHGDDSRWSIP